MKYIHYLTILLLLGAFATQAIAKEKTISFQLKTLDNEVVLIDSLVNEKPVLIVFWALWCKYCKVEINHLSKEMDKSRILSM